MLCEGELVNDRVCYQQVGNPSRMIWFLTPYWYIGKRDEKALGHDHPEVGRLGLIKLRLRVRVSLPNPSLPKLALAKLRESLSLHASLRGLVDKG